MKRESKNGKVFTCNNCNKIHLEFGNFSIDFENVKSLQTALDGLKRILESEIIPNISTLPQDYKIMIPMTDGSCKFILTVHQLHELTRLIMGFIRQTTHLELVPGQKNIPPRLLNGIDSFRLN